tara:strand:- start:32 stop:418 length:387 start_codon:yes stop_codon:yes gene_type:complete
VQKNILLEKITKHSDYAEMRNGYKISMPGFVLQGKPRNTESRVKASVARYGLTCSKRIGNAVKRNRVKRRLRSLAANILPVSGLEGWDYILIGRLNSSENLSFRILKENLATALTKLHNRNGERTETD